jgi:hypothetical protein
VLFAKLYNRVAYTLSFLLKSNALSDPFPNNYAMSDFWGAMPSFFLGPGIPTGRNVNPIGKNGNPTGKNGNPTGGNGNLNGTRFSAVLLGHTCILEA